MCANAGESSGADGMVLWDRVVGEGVGKRNWSFGKGKM